MVAIREHFRTEGPGQAREWTRQHRWFIKAKQDKQRREDIADDLDDSATAVGLASSAIAPPPRVAELEATLTAHEQATVAALMENEKVVSVVRSALDELLAQAFVMEDGRRVFITEDGTQVFDEFGVEVSPDELDFDLIPENAPKWEEYQPKLEERQALDAERDALFEHQAKLDAARDVIAEGDLTEADLDALEADLLDNMPSSVAAKLPGADTAAVAPESGAGLEQRATTSPNLGPQSIFGKLIPGG